MIKHSSKFKILEHTADLKLRVFGKTKQELFKNVMLGMFESARVKAKEEETKIEREIKIESADILFLLVDFLSEVLYLSEVNNEVYWQIRFEEFSDTRLKGKIIGGKIRQRGLIIKGVTYHNLEISQSKKGLWQVVILFDI